MTAEDGVTEAYGPFSNFETTTKHASQLRKRSAAYGAKNPVGDYRVVVAELKRWPGIREWVKSLL